MWLLLVVLAATPTSAPAELEKLATTLRGSPAWRATFVQTYVPAGFEEGTTEAGTVVLAPPDRLRFDYSGDSSRIFAVDGTILRSVDQEAGTCDAVVLDERTWGRLPLAALLDPTAALASFAVEVQGPVLRLSPRQPNPDVAVVEVVFDSSHLAQRITVTDPSGNRNTFSFAGWQGIGAQADTTFRPSLQGQAPCRPEGS